ncbi:hypothetical protein [Streptosporangium sp. NPDC049078]|uniref:hypothetical protein n=1 Tax=Streptosporangium sp. NPDC049078 TaxID=3155767 RepID=UPI00343B0FDC
MWHDSYVLVVLALAAVAVIAGVTVVAMGRGGELSEFAPDVPPLNLPQAGQLGAVDFMALQLPVSLVGYNTQSVDETLSRVAGALSERDTRIAVLEQRVSELLAGRLQARHELNPGSRTSPRGPEAPYELSGGDGFGPPEELSSGSRVVSGAESERSSGPFGGDGFGPPEELSSGSRVVSGAGDETSGSSGGDGFEASEKLSDGAKAEDEPEEAAPSKDSEPEEPLGSEEAGPSKSSEPEKAPRSEEDVPSKDSEPEETARPDEASEASGSSGVSPFARPSEPPQVPDSSSSSETSDSKKSSPGSVGLRTGERETEDTR